MAESSQGELKVQDHDTQRRQRPAGGRLHSGAGVGGAPIRYGHWRPEGDITGVCLVLPGRREFIEKYFEVVSDLLARGYEVFTFDWRGQGKSMRLLDNRQKGYIGDFDEYLADLDLFIKRVVAREKSENAPDGLLCLAHSMGAHVALRHAHDHPHCFARMILVSPMIGINFPAMSDAIVRLIVNMACSTGMSRRYAPFQHDFDDKTTVFDGNLVTSDPGRFSDEAFFVHRDTQLAMGGITYAWLRAALRSMDILQKPGFAEAIKTPILVAVAGEDRVVNIGRAKQVAKRLPNGHMITIGDSRHEILREKDAVRSMFWRMADEFLAL